MAEAEEDDQGRSEELSELAIQDYTYALELDPNNIDYLLQRGSVLHGLNRWKDAKADFAQVLALDPNNASALAGLGWAAFQQGVQAYNVNDTRRSSNAVTRSAVYFSPYRRGRPSRGRSGSTGSAYRAVSLRTWPMTP